MKIQCEGLSYRYPGSRSHVFENFNIDFHPGVTLLKGYSGCGKSTLLRLLGGLLKPDCGRIRTEGFLELGSQKFMRSEFAVVFQELNLLPLATVERNIYLSCRIAGVSLDHGRDWLKRLGMIDFAKKKVDHLSGGQKQRVAIARAMSKFPKLLVLDEPTSGLDDTNTNIIRGAVEKYSKTNQTICVIASHDQRLDSVADVLVDFHSILPLAK